MAGKRLCSIPGCDKPHEARGWCSFHYGRWRKLGSTDEPENHRKASKYYEQVVAPYDGDDCLIWPYARFPAGYAVLGNITVHRKLCIEVHGPAPSPSHQAAHTCGNGLNGCVTKRHLVWKTPKENQADRLLHGTHCRGEKNYHAKISEDDARYILTSSEKGRTIARRLGVTEALVSAIRNKRAWKWLET
jgi:hypothetical protein